MASTNVPEYHKSICAHLDKLYAKGFAKENPQLVGQLVIAAAIDEAGSDIAKKLEHLQESVRTDHPLMGETLDGISTALQSIADAIDSLRPPSQDD